MKFSAVSTLLGLAATAAAAAAAPTADSHVKDVEKNFVKATNALVEVLQAGNANQARSGKGSVEKRCDDEHYWPCLDQCNAMFCPIGGCGFAKAACIATCKDMHGPGCP